MKIHFQIRNLNIHPDAFKLTIHVERPYDWRNEEWKFMTIPEILSCVCFHYHPFLLKLIYSLIVIIFFCHMRQYIHWTYSIWRCTWWRHQMETFSALLALCDRNPVVTCGFPSQRPVTWSFDIFFDLRLNKRLSKRSSRRWCETPLRLLWRHCNDRSVSL